MSRQDTPQYRAAYQRGWKSGNTEGALDRADGRNEPDAWYDGYMDRAVGRDKWHYLHCPSHGVGPGTCGKG